MTSVRSRRGRRGSRRSEYESPPSPPMSPFSPSLPGAPANPFKAARSQQWTMYVAAFMAFVVLLMLGLYVVGGGAQDPPSRPVLTRSPTHAPTFHPTHAHTSSPTEAPPEPAEIRASREKPPNGEGIPPSVAELQTLSQQKSGETPVRDDAAPDELMEDGEGVKEVEGGEDLIAETEHKGVNSLVDQSDEAGLDDVGDDHNPPPNPKPDPSPGPNGLEEVGEEALDELEQSDEALTVVDTSMDQVPTTRAGAESAKPARSEPLGRQKLEKPAVSKTKKVMLRQAKLAQQAAESSEAAAVQARKHAQELWKAANELRDDGGQSEDQEEELATLTAADHREISDLASEEAAALAEADSVDSIEELASEMLESELPVFGSDVKMMASPDLTAVGPSPRQGRLARTLEDHNPNPDANPNLEDPSESIDVLNEASFQGAGPPSLDGYNCSQSAPHPTQPVFILAADFVLPRELVLSRFKSSNSNQTAVFRFNSQCAAAFGNASNTLCLHLRHYDPAAQVLAAVEIRLSLNNNSHHSLTLLSNDASYALQIIKTTFPTSQQKEDLAITSQAWSSEDAVLENLYGTLFAIHVCDARAALARSARWPAPKKRAGPLFPLKSYTDGTQIKPVFLVRWQTKAASMLLNAGQLGPVGGQHRSNQARLFGIRNHGLQYRVVDNAGIVMTVVVSFQAHTIEVLCNDKDFALSRLKRLFLGVADSQQQNAGSKFAHVFKVNDEAAFNGWTKQHKFRRKFIKAIPRGL